MDIKLDQILLQALNFGVLFLVLSKFLYKPVLKILEQRAQKIDAGLTAAQKNLEEQVHIQETKKQELKKAQVEAQKIIKEARDQAEASAKKLLEDAKAEAATILSKEEAALTARLKVQEAALMQRTQNMVINLTKAVLKQSLTPAAQEQILAHQVKTLKTLSVN